MNYWKFPEHCTHLKKQNYIYKDFFSWLTRHQVWSFFFSGFYFDDLFSILLKTLFSNFFLLPSFFIFDKWFSFWTGFGFIKSYLKLFNSLFYFERFDTFFFFFSLVISILFLSIIFYTLIFFII